MLLCSVVEVLKKLDPLALAARDRVEVFFHLGREVAFDEVAEVLAQQLRHRERGEAGHERFPLPEDVSAPNDGRDRRRVG